MLDGLPPAPIPVIRAGGFVARCSMYDLFEKTLFEWQRDCLKKWFDNGCRGIVNVVTGAGKTVLALAAAHNLRADTSRMAETLKVKIVVPKVFLAAQWQKAIIEELHIPRDKIGIYRNSHDASKEFMIYVVNSARYSISRHILADMKAGYSVLLICDECHHYGSGENSKIFDFMPHIDGGKYYALGLSATPRSQNYKDVLVPALGREIYKYGFGSAVSENVISAYSICNIAVHFDSDELDAYSKLSVQISKNISWLKREKPYLSSLSGVGFFHALQEMTSGTGKSAGAARTALALMYNRKKLCIRRRRGLIAQSTLSRHCPQPNASLFSRSGSKSWKHFTRSWARYIRGRPPDTIRAWAPLLAQTL